MFFVEFYDGQDNIMISLDKISYIKNCKSKRGKEGVIIVLDNGKSLNIYDTTYDDLRKRLQSIPTTYQV